MKNLAVFIATIAVMVLASEASESSEMGWSHCTQPGDRVCLNCKGFGTCEIDLSGSYFVTQLTSCPDEFFCDFGECFDTTGVPSSASNCICPSTGVACYQDPWTIDGMVSCDNGEETHMICGCDRNVELSNCTCV